MPRSAPVREDMRRTRRTSMGAPSLHVMSSRSPQPVTSDLSLVDEVAALAADVREQVARLRPAVDSRAIDPNSDLTVLLGALNAVAGKLEARCEALRGGAPEPAPAGGPTPITRPLVGASPENVARDMVVNGASRTEVEDFLRRHYDRAEARQIARRVMRPTAEPRASRRRER